jgi:exodeoxyribonuclease V alpha subunit
MPKKSKLNSTTQGAFDATALANGIAVSFDIVADPNPVDIPKTTGQHQRLLVNLQRVRWSNNKNWGVVEVAIDDNYYRDMSIEQRELLPEPIVSNPSRVVIVGDITTMKAGILYEVEGDWITNEKYGLQLSVMWVAPVQTNIPDSVFGFARWLEENVPGIGITTAQRIFRHITVEQLVNLLRSNPLYAQDGNTGDTAIIDRLHSLGLRIPQAQSLLEMWREMDSVTSATDKRDIEARRNLSVYLYGGGISTGTINRAISFWGSAQKALSVLVANPYALTRLNRVGFILADRFAQKQGIAVDSPSRIAAAIKYTLEQMQATGGHLCVSVSKLIETCEKITGQSARLISTVLGELHIAGYNKLIGSSLPNGLFEKEPVKFNQSLEYQNWTVGFEVIFSNNYVTVYPVAEFGNWQSASQYWNANDLDQLNRNIMVYSHIDWLIENHLVWYITRKLNYDQLFEQELANRFGVGGSEDVDPLTQQFEREAKWLKMMKEDLNSFIKMSSQLERQGYKLNLEQQEAVFNAIHNRLSVITGGAGVGKTSCIRALVQFLTYYAPSDFQFALVAPTGKASKRMTIAFEGLGVQATTVHKLLGFGANKEEEGVPALEKLYSIDFVIVDEASMVDNYMFYQLIAAIKPSAHIVLVGDANQLPSVGPGQILHDLMAVSQIKTTELVTVYRQSAHSTINQNAAAINAGNMPYVSSSTIAGTNLPNLNGDFVFIPRETPQEIAQEIIRLTTALEEYDYYLAMGDIQVLSPQKTTDCGVEALNTQLQAYYNSLAPNITPEATKFLQIELKANFKKAEEGGGTETGRKTGAVRKVSQFLRVSDLVLFCRNNYTKKYFNGDTGKVLKIYPQNQSVIIELDSPTNDGYNEIELKGDELDDIMLAYAMTVHKSQGSEYKCVIVPVTTSHFISLTRQLIYTAVTRGKEKVILVGQKKALAIALNNSTRANRNTGLANKLQALLSI